MTSLVLTEEHLGKPYELNLWNIAEFVVTAEFKKWLNAPDPSANHNSARKKHHKDTGQWLLQDQRYVNWKKQPNSFMWINGTCESDTLYAIIMATECATR